MRQSGISSLIHAWEMLHPRSSMPRLPAVTIGVSSISLAEMVYLIENARIPAGALKDLQSAIADSKAVLKHVPLDENVAMKMAEVPRQDVPDLPDRVIAATALLRGVPVLSRDDQIRSSSIKTIW
jgi:predicted nucleic acid-binding protein